MWNCGPAPTSAAAGNAIRSFDRRAETALFVLEGIRGGEGSGSMCECDAACKGPGLPGCPALTDTSGIERTQGPQARRESDSTERPGPNRPLRFIWRAGPGMPKGSPQATAQFHGQGHARPRAALKTCTGSDFPTCSLPRTGLYAFSKAALRLPTPRLQRK